MSLHKKKNKKMHNKGTWCTSGAIVDNVMKAEYDPRKSISELQLVLTAHNIFTPKK